MKLLVVLALVSATAKAEDLYHQIHLQRGAGYSICTGTESHYIPDPDDCHNFYGCVYDEHQDYFHVYKFECQPGLAYDIESHACQDELTVDRCWYTCRQGWDFFQNSCYLFKYGKTHDTFLEAKQACSDIDAYLVEIESKDEDDFIIAKALELATSAKDGHDYWIGAEDLDEDGVWHWTTSGNPVVYSNWWAGAGSLNSNCAQLLKNGLTQPANLDSFYWIFAAGKKDCSGGDGDNGYICEMAPIVQLP